MAATALSGLVMAVVIVLFFRSKTADNSSFRPLLALWSDSFLSKDSS
ncbi:hypothetical protein CBZ99_004172 [Salmonella enterica subsp. houtenae serovar 40:z4,z24:-]|nr:hypothetical protein [Salmonella enterica subsp. houtenae serovar 40:z4,z24:-]